MATSKIKSVNFKSEWTNPNTNKIIFYHDVEFENGDKGQIGTMTKLPDKLNVGTEHSYTIENKNGNNKIVIDQPQNNRGGNFPKKDPETEALKQRMIIAQSSLSNAVEFLKGQQPTSREMIFDLAGAMYDWVINKSKQ